MPALTTVRGVAIARVGEWDASTGTWVCTREDLADAVRAASDPAFRSGVLKLGHADPRFNSPDHDATPVLGRLENLRLDDTGDVLLADLVGVPTWLAEVMASAYPSRSIEASLGVVTGDGRTYRMVVTGLALLGESPPAIESLGDIAALFEQDTDVDTWVAARAVAATYTPPGATMPTVSHQAAQAAAQVAASAPLDELLNAATAQARTETGQMWIWVREVWTDSLILDDDDGRLWRMDWSEANGTFTFGSLVPVKVTYTPISDNVAARAAHRMSRPVHYVRGRGDVSASTPAEGEQPVAELGAQLRERYGLPADADDAAVLAAIDAAEQPPASQEDTGTPSGETRTPSAHADTEQDTSQQANPDPASAGDDIEARVAAALERHMKPVLEQLGTVSTELAARKAKESADTRTRVIEAALADGKIKPSDRARWEADYDEAPGPITRVLSSLAPGTAFPVRASGRAGVPDDSTEDAEADRLNADMFGEEVTSRG
jgi:hypothetical protein